MRAKRAIKSIVALGVGATMMGATLLGAAATDLANYPTDFVDNGTFNGYLVAGDGAKAADTLAVSDIVAGMKISGGSGSSTDVTIVGDSVQVKESSDILEYEEPLSGVIDILGEDELDALASATVRNDKGDFSYKQYLELPANCSVQHTVDPDDDDDVVQDYLACTLNQQVYSYKIEWAERVESDLDGNTLEDLEDEELSILGKTYAIIDATRSVDRIDLQLMGGAVLATLDEGESGSFTVQGQEYEVTLNIVTTNSEVQLTINGETTEKLLEGNTHKLADGTEIGIRDILLQDYAGGKKLVRFYLGAESIDFKDGNVTDDDFGDEVEVGDEDVDDLDVKIKGSFTSTLAKINYIELNYTTNDDLYIPVDGKLSENPELDTPEQIFGDWDIEFKGVDRGSAEDHIQFKRTSDTKIRLEWTNKAGSEMDMNLFYNPSGSLVEFGESAARPLIPCESLYANSSGAIDGGSASDWAIVKDSTFIVNKAKSSFAFEYKGQDVSEGTLQFKDLGTGKTLTASYTGSGDVAVENAEISLGGKSFGVYVYQDITDDGRIMVDLDGDDTLDASEDTFTLYTEHEHKIKLFCNSSLVGHINSLVEVSPNSDGFDDMLEDYTATEVVQINYTADAGKFVNAAPLVTYNNSGLLADGAFMTELRQDADDKEGMTVYGMKLDRNDRDDDADDVDFMIPRVQAEALVYVTAGVTKTVTTSGSGLVSVEFPVTATKLDSEVADLSAQNLILVGGPCVNSATSSIMGSPEDCTEGFTPGKAMIKLYDNGGNVALIVAGYSADDTRRAGKVLMKYGDYGLSGSEVEVSGATFTDISVTTVE